MTSSHCGPIDQKQVKASRDEERGIRPKQPNMNPLDGGEGEEEREDGSDEVEAEEQAEVRLTPKPPTPTKEEVEKHEATHGEFRSWCAHCVRGCGISSPHTHDARASNVTSVPEFVMDYP